MSQAVRKCVFWVFDHVIPKPGCIATELAWSSNSDLGGSLEDLYFLCRELKVAGQLV